MRDTYERERERERESERTRVAGSFLNFETTHTRERFCTLEMKTFRVLPYLKGEKMMTLLALPL